MSPHLIIRTRSPLCPVVAPSAHYRTGLAWCSEPLSKGGTLWRVLTLHIPTALDDLPDLAKSAALPAGARWITAHPNGKDQPGVPIMVRESAESKGTYYVIGGAGGKMNHLKLTGIKSKEEYQADQKAKQADKREKKKAEERELARTGVLDTKQAHDAAIDSARKHKEVDRLKSYIGDVLPVLGFDPADYTFDEAKAEGAGLERDTLAWGLAEYNFYTKVAGQVGRRIEELNRQQLLDEDARVRAGTTAMRLTGPRSVDVALAHGAKVEHEAEVEKLDLMLDAARSRGDYEALGDLQAKRDEAAAAIQEADATIVSGETPTIDQLAGKKVWSGVGYNAQTKDDAIAAMVESGDLHPDKLDAAAADTSRPDRLIRAIGALAASNSAPGGESGKIPEDLLDDELHTRQTLLKQAADAARAGNHATAFACWKTAEKIATAWELRVQKANSRDPESKMSTGDYLQLVTDSVIRGRAGMRALSQATQQGVTAVPEDLQKAQIHYDTLRQALSIKKKYDAIGTAMDRAKKDAQDSGAEAGYVIDSDAIRDKFHIDAMSDDAAIAKAEAEIAQSREAYFNNALLHEVEASDTLLSQLDLTRTQLQQAMAQHISGGAHQGFANATLLATGDVLLDRRVVDAFGTKGAASLVAAHLKSSLDPDQFAALQDGLSAHHAETSTEQAQQALARAEKAYTTAKNVQFEKEGVTVDVTDPIQMQYLNDKRRSVLEATMQDLGRTIGTLRAQAELTNALKNVKAPAMDSDWSDLSLPMGDTQTDALLQRMAALGLTRDEYEITHDAGSKTNTLRLQHSAIPKLCRSDLSQAELDIAATNQTIKNGGHDESGWLPTGIARRPPSSFDVGDVAAPQFAISPQFAGLSGDDLHAHVADYIGSHVADGWPIEHIVGTLRSASFQTQHLTSPDMFDPDAADQPAEVDASISRLIPQLPTGQMDTKAITAFRAQREAAAQHLAEQFRAKHGLSAETIHSQGIIPDATALEAVHRSLARNPAAVLAFKAPMDLTPRDKNALRAHFWRALSPEKQEESTARKKGEQATKDAQHAAPQVQSDTLFDFGDVEEDHRLTKQYGEHDTLDVTWGDKTHTVNARAWQEEQRALQRKHADTQRDMFGDPTGADGEMSAGGQETAARHAWDRYLQAHGGNQDLAYRSLQEHLKGQFNEAFATTYSTLSGQPLKTSKVAMSMPDAHAVGTAAPDQYEERLQQMRNPLASEMAQVGKDGSGKFVSGSRKEAASNALRTRAEDQRSFFAENEVARDAERSAQRTTIGERAENQVASIINAMADRWNPKANPVKMFSVSMGDNNGGEKFYKQQRAIRLIANQKKVGLWLGAGSGKSITTLGAYTHLNGTGEVRRAIFAVPSVVEEQFGGEALRFLDPATKRADGREGYRWHAKPGSGKDVRHAALRDDKTDFVVATHQSIRDDAIHALSEHQGMDAGAVSDWFNDLPRADRAARLKEAFHHMGWHGFDMLYVDEAHYIANRQGKENSLMANILDAIGDNASHHILGSGTPVKNDPSEAFDMLSKLDGARFHDRKHFMRQYGGDTAGAREALQRLTSRYFYQDKVESGVTGQIRKNQVPMTEVQKQQYKEVQDAFNAIKVARQDAKRAGGQIAADVLVPHMRTLSPNSFADLPADQHERKARELLPAVGTVREAAFNRVINAGRFKDNGKMQHIAQLADRYRNELNPKAAGGPRTGKPGVIFARNLESVRELERGLKAKGHRVVTLTGEMSGEDKAKAKRAFSPDVAPDDVEKYATADIIIMSDAGNTGLNLQRGKWLIHLDTPFTSPVKEQRDARVNRIGQVDDVDLHELITDTPFDGTAQRRLARKAVTSHVFQDKTDTLDDTGLARQVHAAYNRLTGQTRMAGAAAPDSAGMAQRKQQRQRAVAQTATAQADVARRRRTTAGPPTVAFTGAETPREVTRQLATAFQPHVPADQWSDVSGMIARAVGSRGGMSQDQWQGHLHSVAHSLRDHLQGGTA